ncbi:MAG: endopeptidase La [Planctomycetes bacterium]|nr:endopeptidase La [Planctomycetota bacterium]
MVAHSENGPKGVSQLPVVPISDNVVFPFTVIPLSITAPKAVAAVEYAMSRERTLAMVAVKGPFEGSLTADNLFKIGTAARIVRLFKAPDGSLNLILQGAYRIRVVDMRSEDNVFVARVKNSPEKKPADRIAAEALTRKVLDQFRRLVQLTPYLSDELETLAQEIDNPLQLAYLAGALIRMEKDAKQEILELDLPEKKLSRVYGILQQELAILEMGNKIQSEAQTEISKSQREYFLREQLKAIRRELGELDATMAEVEELREKISKTDLPEEVAKEADKQVGRLERIPTASAEYSVVRTYLDWLLGLPWRVSTQDNLNLRRARRFLDEDHWDLEKVKERVVEFLAVRKLKKDSRGPILCFVGPPGVGKTSLGQSIARALGRKFIRMSLGGIRDEAEIRGHRRTYVGALPGRIIQGIERTGTNNPVFMLDEIDKVGADFRGDPSSALLEVLDPEQNFSFRDHYVEMPFDLSHVLFIATGNITDTIQPALRDRMEIIELPGYTEEDKVRIAGDHLVPRQIGENGIPDGNLRFTAAGLREIVRFYTFEAGVRNLERNIAAICRKYATKYACGRRRPQKIGPEEVRRYLGPQRRTADVARRTSRAGVATGLAWTPSGGDVLFIEALSMPGKGNLLLTGHLGDVMQESARAALSYVRHRAGDLGIGDEYFRRHDIHIHVPAGAIPKDGPSAGVTMASAIVSCLTGRPVKKDVAMTGEITLAGHVLPIGGLKEKVLAARRAGIRTVIFPRQNKPQLDDIPAKLRRHLKFTLVETVDEVWDAALFKTRRLAPGKGGR